MAALTLTAVIRVRRCCGHDDNSLVVTRARGDGSLEGGGVVAAVVAVDDDDVDMLRLVVGVC
jgi:hypothetical protein